MEEQEVNALENINFTKFGHLSKKAISNILPYLEEGLQYDKACQSAGYHYKDDDANPKYKLPVIPKEDIRNPVVYRAVTQTRKVINAIIDKYGSPFEIHIEVGNELTKSFKDRKEIENRQKENRELNEKLKAEIEEGFGIKAKPVDMLKVKLYREQQGKSAYSLMPIDYNRLFENGYVQIDHAVPFSRSFDDSYNNKVLVLSKENQDKRNMTPYEYLGGTDKWEIFESFVKEIYKFRPKKRENLLVKNMDEDKEKDWIARNINDTKYMARYLANYLKKNLQFEDYGENSNRVKVKTVTGAATTALRNYWGIHSKNREENDLHHAEDAVIIACASEKYQRKVREYSKEHDLYYRRNQDGEYFDPETGEIVDVKYKHHDMARPWEKFKEELEARMSTNPVHDLKYGGFTNYDDIDIETIRPIFVSRMTDRKIKGQAHEETIYSTAFKETHHNIVTVKKPLNRISKAEIEMVLKDGDCQELYNSDKKIYDAIYERMAKYDFKAEKAFPSDFVLRKQSKKGEGPIVNSIKVPSRMSRGVAVQGGIAANGSMVRVDVFEKTGKFYLVPIYVADMLKEELPNRAIKAHKNEEEWFVMDDTYNFKFSLYHNDLIGIKKNESDKMEYYYYVGADRASGTISYINPNGEKFGKDKIMRSGAQGLATFEKYEVDILGNYHKVKKESRRGGKKKQ